MAKKIRLGDLLINSNKITESDLKLALEKQRLEGKRLGETLIDLGLLKEEDIIDVLHKQLNIQKITISRINIDPKIVKLIPESMCKKHNLFPIGIDDNKIKIAMADPLNIFAVDDTSLYTGLNVITCIATKDEISRAIGRYYSGENVQNAAEELSKEKNIDNKKDVNEEEINDIKNAPAVRMVDYLLKNAVEQRASDIHIEPYENNIRIRFRIDGQLREISTLNKDALSSLVTRIKILSNLNIAEKRVPQDGRIETTIGDKNVDMRISIIPLITGEKVVIRVLDKNGYSLRKKDLGMNSSDLNKAESIMKSPYGIILVTGPTGSGKSTTLYTFLSDLNHENKNIITVEDPVEYTMDGINQVNVNSKIGLTFASGLRSILRQDPDVVMIGEMRDKETAQIGIRAAITGHLVLSTLHTNDAASSIIRLVDMGIEPYLVATAIKGVIAQRLVRRICSYCSEEYEASSYEKQLLEIDEKNKVYLHKGKGCAYCNNTGYKGRVGVYEILQIDRDLKEMILKTQNSDKLKDLAIEKGMKTLEKGCRELVLKGKTTLDEMLNLTFSE